MNWIPVLGQWDIQNDTLAQSDNSGITRCSLDVGKSSFIVHFKFRTTGALPQTQGEVKFIVANANNPDPSLGERWRVDFLYDASRCRILASSLGMLANLYLVWNQNYSARIAVKDNLVSVDIDGMTIIRDFNIGRLSDGCIGLGTYKASAEFSEIIIDPYTEKKCFIVMPFSAHRDVLYDYVVEPTLRQHPRFVFDYIRADKSLTVGRISEEIGELIRNAEVVIADISESNRNVFYELGLAHAFKKTAILLLERVTGESLDIPFDIHDFRCHTYEYSREGFDTLRLKLTALLTNVLSEDSNNSSDSPITR